METKLNAFETSVDGVLYTSDLTRCIGYRDKNCDIKKVVIPKETKRIGPYAFRYLETLEEIIFSNELEGIDCFAFERCRGLKRIVLPEGIEEIELSSFKDCTNLEEIMLPMTLKSIDGYAFESCVNLKKLVLNPNIKKIPASAISNCPNLVIYSTGVEIEYEQSEEDYDISCKFETYDKKDYEKLIYDMKDELKDVFPKEQLIDVIKEEINNLSFI